MRRSKVPILLTGVLLGGLWTACSDDDQEPVNVVSGTLGAKCSCDSDCGVYGAFPMTCFKGICMVQPNGTCQDQGACPDGTVCVDLPHGDETFPVCALSETNEALICHGQWSADGACVPGPEDNCLIGCCSAADPPVEPVEDPYPDRDWDAPACGGDNYPCPPYGIRKGRTIANEVYLPGNDEARTLAGQDGILSLDDVRRTGAKLIIVFGSASW